MTKIPIKYIKSLKTVPSLWLGVLVVAYFYPQYALSFMIGTTWGVLWMITYNWLYKVKEMEVEE